MAIYKYTPGSATVALSDAAELINAHKTGTFLDNATVSANDSSSSASLTITLGTGSFVLNTGSGLSQNMFIYTQLKNGNTSVADYGYYPNASSSYLKLSAMYFCKNGIIFKIEWKYNGDQYGSILALTANEDGELAVMAVYCEGNNLNMVTGAFTAFYCTSPSSYMSRINTGASIQDHYTAISGIAVASKVSDGTVQILPNAFYAYETQARTSNYSELYTIMLNGIAYISNGVWYIKDE